MGQLRRKQTYGISHNYEGRERSRLCPRCGNILGSKILLPGEIEQPDHELWLQCAACGTIRARYETSPETKLETVKETIDNPHDYRSKMTGTKNKRSSKKKTELERKRERQKRTIEKETDPDIQREMKKHGAENVKVHQ
jgi:hypothetical protein